MLMLMLMVTSDWCDLRPVTFGSSTDNAVVVLDPRVPYCTVPHRTGWASSTRDKVDQIAMMMMTMENEV